MSIYENNYKIITNHQKLLCTLNILVSIEEPNTNIIKAQMLVEDEIQDSWETIRQIENAEKNFIESTQVQGVF